jgi:hypothetical protein
MIAPRELLDTSIGQIQTLAAFLREQLAEGNHGSEFETAETRACNEILADLTVLILRLEAARPDVSGGMGLAGYVAARRRRTEENEQSSSVDGGQSGANRGLSSQWREPMIA